MGLFHFFPKVDRFCWCTRNLKCASFIIIFLGMMASIHTAGLLGKPACKELFDVSSPVKLPVNILRWTFFTFEMILMASSFVFMLGLFWSLPITADIFICSAVLTCFISIIYVILMLIQEQYTHCRWYYSQMFHLILYFIMWCYFVVVVNSYIEQLVTFMN